MMMENSALGDQLFAEEAKELEAAAAAKGAAAPAQGAAAPAKQLLPVSSAAAARTPSASTTGCVPCSSTLSLAAGPAAGAAAQEEANSWNTFRWIPEGVIRETERRRDTDGRLYTARQFARCYPKTSEKRWAAASASAVTSYACSCRGCRQSQRRLEFGAVDDVIAHLERSAGFRFVVCKCGDRVWDQRLRAHINADHPDVAMPSPAPPAAQRPAAQRPAAQRVQRKATVAPRKVAVAPRPAMFAGLEVDSGSDSGSGSDEE